MVPKDIKLALNFLKVISVKDSVSQRSVSQRSTLKTNALFFFPFSGVIVILSILYGIVALLTLYGNTLILWIVSTTKSMQDVINLYICNLAIGDITLALFCIPFQFYAALVQRWDLPKLMCKICPGAQTLSMNVSIFTLLAIAQER